LILDEGLLFTTTARCFVVDMDNRKAVVERFGEKIGSLLCERFTVHYTPKHGRWLNQAEIEISRSVAMLGTRRNPVVGTPAATSAGVDPKDEP
jgi:hypothetical protein